MRKVSGPILTVSETYSALDLIGSGETGAITATPIAVTLDVQTRLLPGVDIKVSGISSTTAGIASVTLRGWIEPE